MCIALLQEARMSIDFKLNKISLLNTEFLLLIVVSFIQFVLSCFACIWICSFQVKWLLKLSEIPEIAEVPSFSEDARSFLDRVIYNFDQNDALEVKNIEKVTNHDVKAVEYFLKKKCRSHTEIAKVLEYFHFACTSEDINNLAYALALKEALNNVLFPSMVELCKTIYNMAKENMSIPMLSRTHGQTASPTTLGKEMLIFAHRLSEQGKEFPKILILGKFAGAVGNYNAHMAAYPDINWATVAEEFVKSLGISFNPYVTQVLEYFHFACTSEDINNLAYALALKEALNNVLFPSMVELCKTIYNMAKKNMSTPMLSRTHGQTASPTTLGKEMLIFAHRLSEQGKEFPKFLILGKFAGAVGNYNAHMAAYPDINWATVAEEFVKSLGISFNPYVTQIEPHDYIARIFGAFVLFNNILVDFDRDIWSYVSLGYFKQIVKAGEIGSSTMPHKVNPIDFENSEGNLCMANALLAGISGKLVISRMQRDLTDSTVLRNLGVGLGYSLLAYKSALQGIHKLQVNEAHLREDLEQSWEVLAEPIQTVMRRHGIPEPYEKLKELTRGRSVTKESIRDFVVGLELPDEAKSSLLKLTPHAYIGAAADLVKSAKPDVNLLDGFKIL
ncbi:hypothetical protein Taro_031042 [Colocasia esculenta]|uniref:Adenylosuccinate lyase n=1 Tax=Colocasia esculenta TaxID=4460 RepID=A0A843VMX5_COLES|nr:hypothetical protein [Colocasia esculenta]